MKDKKKKRKASGKSRPYEVRDYMARKLISSGMTIDKFNKILGIRK